MSAYPKHYLADVPHELRMRVLDLCIHRRWNDALDLLHQNGFTQYEWYELVWFHDHAPTNLPLPTGSTGDSPVPLGDPPTGIPTNLDSVGRSVPAEPITVPDSDISNVQCEIAPSPVVPSRVCVAAHENPEPRAVNPAPLALTPLSASVVKSSPLKPKRRRPRSKASRLPQEIQHTLNTMLAGGCRYRDIIRSLNTRGYPGFNKVNLNAWKRTGFQNWLSAARRQGKSTVLNGVDSSPSIAVP